MAATPESACSRGRRGPEASQSYRGLDFPFHSFLLNHSLSFIFFPPWTQAISNNSHYCALQDPEQHSNEVPDLISALQPPAGRQQPVLLASNSLQAL